MEPLASPMTTIEKDESNGLQTMTLRRPGMEELFLTAMPRSGNLERMFEDALRAVRDRGAAIVGQDVFAPIGGEGSNGSATAPQIFADVCGEIDWPVTWIDSGHRRGSTLAGTQIHAVIGAPLRRIERDGRVIATCYEDDDARFCRMGDLRSGQTDRSRTEQARHTFELIESVLAEADMTFLNVVRTWLYLDELLDWYGPFNKVRTDFFNEHGVFDNLVPSSTGISGANPAGAAVMAGALALEPKSDEFIIREVFSPLQCPAPKYGSSFSRAMEYGTGAYRRMSISGTASIAPEGATVYLDDIEGQIRLTVEVMEAILTSREMSWQDVARAIAYVKDASYTAPLGRIFHEKGLAEMPTLITENDICRDDLLFEMELEAATVNGCSTD